MMSVKLQSVSEILGLFSSPDELNDGEELLMPIDFFLLLEDEHEVMTEARLHHNPVHRTGKVDVRREKNNVFTLQRGDTFVRGHEMKHDLFEAALPFAGGSGTRARIRS